MTETTIAPIMRTVTVNRSVEEAFRIFTREMGSWWPLETHSMATDTYGGTVRAESVVFEEREGGRVYEVMSDGTEGSWGTVLAWDPPHRFAMTWKPNANANPPTELEVRFAREGGGTRVELEHRGWERLGEIAAEAREGYASGWPGVLELYQAAANEEVA